jgi:hypothetical protein
VNGGITFDAGGLIALERNERRVVALLARAATVGAEVVIPATALAQVLRRPARQARLMRLLRQPTTVTAPLDRPSASFVGQLLGATGTTDVVDAHVVVCARMSRHAIVTSDAGDLRRLDPTLDLIEV